MENESKGLSIAALVLGIISMVCCCIGFPFAIIGLILAVIALAKGKGGKGMAIGGLVTSIITLIISTIVGIMMIPVMPYFGDLIEFGREVGADPQGFVDEYEETGEFPDYINRMLEEGVITEEDAEKTMDQVIDTLKKSGNVK